MGENLNFNLVGDYEPYFTIQHQLEPTDLPVEYKQSVDSKTQPRPYSFNPGQGWLNSFAFLDNKSDGAYIHISTDSQLNQLRSPKFEKQVYIQNNDKSMYCYDLDYLNQNTYVVSCANSEMSNVYLVNDNGEIINEISTTIAGIIKQTIHVLRQYEQVLILQGNTMQVDSFVQVYQYVGNKFIKVAVLDTKTISKLAKLSDFQLYLIDVQVSALNQIYILDKLVGPISFELTQLFEWIFIKVVSQQVVIEYYAFDVKLAMFADKKAISKYETQIILIGQMNKSDVIIFGITANLVNLQVFTYFQNTTSKVFRVYCSKSIAIAVNEQQIVLVDVQQNSKLIIKEFEGQIHVLADPFSDSMIVFTDQYSQAYSISQGKLHFSHSVVAFEGLRYFNVTAQVGEMVCDSQINFIVYDSRNSQLYNSLTYDVFYIPKTIYFPTFPDLSFYTQSVISGPSKQAQIYLNGIENNVSYFDDVILEGMSFKDAIFIDTQTIFTLTNGIQFYYFIQNSDLNCYIYICTQQLLYKSMRCSLQLLFANKVKLNQNIFQMQQGYLEQPYLYYGIIRNEHEIVIYKLQDKYQIIEYVITTSFADSESKISQFKIHDDYIFLIVPDKQQIIVHSITQRKQIALWDSQYLFKQGITDWNPKSIYCSITRMQYVLYFISGNYLIIGNLIRDLIIVKQILISTQTPFETAIVIGPNSFCLIYKSPNEQAIYEYSITNVDDIYLKKMIPLYHYTIQSPLTISTNQQLGRIFIKAYTPVLKQFVILVVQINVSLRESLITTINMGISNEATLISVASSYQYYYVQIKCGKFQFYAILSDRLKVTIKPKYLDFETFLSSVNVEMQFYNIDYPKVLTKFQLVQFVNLFTNVEIQLNTTDEHFQLNNNEIYQKIIISDDVLKGQILSVDLSCLQCSNDETSVVFITKKLQFQTNIKLDFKMITMQPFESNGILAVLTESFILLISADTLAIKSSLVLVYQYPPLKLFTYGNEFIVVIRSVNWSVCRLQLFIYYNNSCKLVAEQQLDRMSYVSQLQIVGDIIVLLTGEQSYPYYSENAIYFYKIIRQGSEYQITQLQYIIDSKFINEQFIATDFTIVNYNEVYTLFITSLQFVYIIALQSDFKPVLISSVDIKLLIEKEYSFQDYFVTYVSLKPSFQPYFNQQLNYVSYGFIITTYQSNSYGITINLRMNDKSFEYISSTLDYMLLSFGSLYQQRQFSICNGYAAITYWHPTNKIITLYKIPTEPYPSKLNNPILTISGIILNLNEYALSSLTMNSFGDTVLVYGQNNYILAVSKVYQNYYINIKDTQLFLFDQPIQVIASNYFTSSDITIRITQVHSDDQSTDLMWWITIGVTVTLLITLLVILLLNKINKNKKKQQKQRRITLMN